MKYKSFNALENKTILELNKFIHKDTKLFNYHINHILLTRKYAITIKNKLGIISDTHKISYAALAHDLFKDRAMNDSLELINWNNYNLPQNLNSYVRNNLDILKLYGMDDYFNTDVQLHPLASVIFLHKEFNITDPEIIYPIMFHSCPIMEVYQSLPIKVKTLIDIMMLADKLSGNYLRINFKELKSPIDLDLFVFGPTGKEFNYTMGLYIARLLSQGSSKEKQSILSTEFYRKRVESFNFNTFKKLGGNVVWEKRKNRLFKMH